MASAVKFIILQINHFTNKQRYKNGVFAQTPVGTYAAILNFQRFSDVSLSLVIEIEECDINKRKFHQTRA
jgi:hypothetical protein